ncbi:MAG: DNA topoisomerase III [Lachnospiraceae bacterium]|nr:DNA topoisomerase III [Lachnospiraceae bacterium]
MGKTLVVAEKPSVARDIARVLKCSKSEKGYISGENYIISWAVGHLITLWDPADYDEKYKKWAFKDLPIVPEEMMIKPIAKTKSQFSVLKKLMNSKEVDSIICATDSGREGELIFRYIYSMALCKKPCKRLWISSMTDKAIKDGFDSLKDISEYDNLYFSAKCRSEADWLVGMNASRAYSLKYDSLLSIGRVQTPTLAMLVARQKEIDSFDERVYFDVTADYGDFKGTWTDLEKNDTKIFEEEKADEIVKKIKGKTGVVADIEKEEKKQLPPLLYDLTELQRDCNKKFGFTAKKTLSVVQSLYETRKMVTYPRTDSRYLSDDMIPKIYSTMRRVEYVNEFKPYTAGIDTKKLRITKRIIDNSKVSDHHAIIPADNYFKTGSLTADEKKVFDLIVRRFVCVFYDAYEYETTKVVIKVEGEDLVSKGKVVLKEGWQALYKDDKAKAKEDEGILPPLEKGNEVNVISAKKAKKKTSPPKPYTEASLLSAMENAGRFVEDEEIKEQLKDSGLGTPATRAAIIERLIDVGYVTRKAKALIPTQKGIKLIEIVPDELKSPQTTGKWEKGLSSVSKGKMKDERFMGSIKKFVYFLVNDAYSSKKDVVFEKEERKYKKRSASGGLGACPACKKGRIYENTKGYYCSEWRNGCGFTVWKNCLDIYGGKVDNTLIKDVLSMGIVKNVDMTLPQTGERCTAQLALRSDFKGLEYKNVTKKEGNQ